MEASKSRQVEGILNCLNALQLEARGLGAHELMRLIGVAALAAEDGLMGHGCKAEHRAEHKAKHEAEVTHALCLHREGSTPYGALRAPHNASALRTILQVVDGGRR